MHISNEWSTSTPTTFSLMNYFLKLYAVWNRWTYAWRQWWIDSKGKQEVPPEVKAEIVVKISNPTLIYVCDSWTTIKKQADSDKNEIPFLRSIEVKTRRDNMK